MRLEQELLYVKDVVAGDAMKIEGGVLTVDVDGLRQCLLEDDKIKDVQIDFAKPGERVRIVPVKDVIEPR